MNWKILAVRALARVAYLQLELHLIEVESGAALFDPFYVEPHFSIF